MTTESQSGFVTIAIVMKTQGRIGEVAAALRTNFPERFAERKRLFALDKHNQRREMKLEDYWFHKGQVVLKFAAVDDIDGAEELIGCEIQVLESERTLLQDGSMYVSDLIGCTVSDSGREIGTISDVQFGSGEAPLLVVKGQKEYLLPFAGEYLEAVALKEKQICMKLPPGMLELDAPLSREEKQRQKQED
ncbi:MAG: ribosome maturation factor RimM [Candidatus Angelobacter sp.]